MVVTAPSLEVQEAMNHVEQMQQAVQTYQTMMGVKQGIEKTVDAVEKVNSKLATVREVLDHLAVADAKVTVVDMGALDCTIKARVECAVFRGCGIDEGYPWGGEVR